MGYGGKQLPPTPINLSIQDHLILSDELDYQKPLVIRRSIASDKFLFGSSIKVDDVIVEKVLLIKHGDSFNFRDAVIIKHK